MIKNIIFDVGDVLVEFSPMNSFKKVYTPERYLQAALDATVNSKYWVELDRGIIAEEKVISMMMNDVNNKYDEKTAREINGYIRLFFDEGKDSLVHAFDYSRQWLEATKERFNVYILSNYPASYFELHRRECLEFLDIADGIVVSAYEGLIKPDVKIYNTLLNRYKLNANECVFIDDREANIKGAKMAGMYGIVFKNLKQVEDELEKIIMEA